MINFFLQLNHPNCNSIYNQIQEHSLPPFQDMIDKNLSSGKHQLINKSKIILFTEMHIIMTTLKFVRLLNHLLLVNKTQFKNK